MTAEYDMLRQIIVCPGSSDHDIAEMQGDVILSVESQAILDGVTSRQGVVVHQPRGITALGKEPVLFDDLCATAGILNALGAVRVAERVAVSR